MDTTSFAPIYPGIEILEVPHTPPRWDLLHAAIDEFEDVVQTFAANSDIAENTIHGKLHWKQTAFLADWLFRHTKNHTLYFITFAAAYLHDVGRVGGGRDLYHGIRGIFEVSRILPHLEMHSNLSKITSYSKNADSGNQGKLLTIPSHLCPQILNNEGVLEDSLEISLTSDKYYPFLFADWSIGVISEIIFAHNIVTDPYYIPSSFPLLGSILAHAFILVRMADILGRYRFGGKVQSNKINKSLCNLALPDCMFEEAFHFITEGKELP